MYKVDTASKQLVPLTPKRLRDLGLFERSDLQEWIEKSPDILGEPLLVIGKERELPSRIRLDLLALDKRARLVVIELKLDESGAEVGWQAIKYVSYCSSFLPDEIFQSYADYLKSDVDDAKLRIEQFIDEELDLSSLNQKQRIILVAKDFHPDVVSAVLWLNESEIDIECIRLRPYVDGDGDLFVTPDIIIPLPEAKDYLERKEIKQRESKRSIMGSFSLEKSALELAELESRLRTTLQRRSELTPRLVRFLELLLSDDRVFSREEVKQGLFVKRVGSNPGQAGVYLSTLSGFLTKTSNGHLRQVVDFVTGGLHGQTKDAYHLVPQYRQLVRQLVDEWNKSRTQS